MAAANQALEIEKSDLKRRLDIAEATENASKGTAAIGCLARYFSPREKEGRIS